MNSSINQAVYRIKNANIVEQLILANTAVFILSYALNSWGVTIFSDWFTLPASIINFLNKPWTLLSYGFLHGGFLHLLFNLILLFYLGNLFLDYFSKRDFLIYYFVGIIVGGIVYLLSYNYIDIFDINSSGGLVGASAGVTSILVGLAAKIPNYSMRFRFIGSVKLLYIAIGFIVLDIIQLAFSINTGGHLAHLGGALVGLLLTSQTKSSKSESSTFTNIFKSKKQKPLKTVYKKSTFTKTVKNANAHQRKIDAILDKISKSGYETLSQEEKDFLFSVGKK